MNTMKADANFEYGYDVLTWTMPLAAMMKIHRDAIIDESIRSLQRPFRNVLLQQFDVLQAPEKLLNEFTDEIAPFARMCVVDNGWAEGKHDERPEIMEKARKLVEGKSIVLDEELGNAEWKVSEAIKPHIEAQEPLMDSTGYYLRPDYKFLICVGSYSRKRVNEIVGEAYETRDPLKVSFVWGIPKKLGQNRYEVASWVANAAMNNSEAVPHIHLLGMTGFVDQDIATIKKLPQSVIVTIDSTWPAYMAINEIPDDVSGKMHSIRTWHELKAWGEDDSKNTRESAFIYHVIDRVRRMNRHWNALRLTA